MSIVGSEATFLLSVSDYQFIYHPLFDYNVFFTNFFNDGPFNYAAFEISSVNFSRSQCDVC